MSERGAVWRFTYGCWIVAVLRMLAHAGKCPALGNHCRFPHPAFESSGFEQFDLGTPRPIFWIPNPSAAERRLSQTTSPGTQQLAENQPTSVVGRLLSLITMPESGAFGVAAETIAPCRG
ncbi:hypothetical protein BR93DRAFT_788607 [Coniochaeta sp. PMI_546]|nr:hypothetical protein BR93DRAFT_788607 [Coniochaeta sp. PMI_546]